MVLSRLVPWTPWHNGELHYERELALFYLSAPYRRRRPLLFYATSNQRVAPHLVKPSLGTPARSRGCVRWVRRPRRSILSGSRRAPSERALDPAGGYESLTMDPPSGTGSSMDLHARPAVLRYRSSHRISIAVQVLASIDSYKYDRPSAVSSTRSATPRPAISKDPAPVLQSGWSQVYHMTDSVDRSP